MGYEVLCCRISGTLKLYVGILRMLGLSPQKTCRMGRRECTKSIAVSKKTVAKIKFVPRHFDIRLVVMNEFEHILCFDLGKPEITYISQQRLPTKPSSSLRCSYLVSINCDPSKLEFPSNIEAIPHTSKQAFLLTLWVNGTHASSQPLDTIIEPNTMQVIGICYPLLALWRNGRMDGRCGRRNVPPFRRLLSSIAGAVLEPYYECLRVRLPRIDESDSLALCSWLAGLNGVHTLMFSIWCWGWGSLLSQLAIATKLTCSSEPQPNNCS